MPITAATLALSLLLMIFGMSILTVALGLFGFVGSLMALAPSNDTIGYERNKKCQSKKVM
ncbi:hypothetical protein SAMN04488527_15710 [Aliiroseovarius crassostreae]|uniref:Uncharacterized protein n=1 Tax=Aliiroseovarius crassostreae TaxID=154981 RepID=A0A0P7KLQ0_9RHOB|nr:hypothetical protein [Aliiroseovarius crassostreae]KPN62984.1 hypothetical protein AKJ29_02210 [Aliiroseovarius crassostreae]SFU96692.1 hypothetical protein SAMN04488527_15710 [Aliiroseovarius crassostreae]